MNKCIQEIWSNDFGTRPWYRVDKENKMTREEAIEKLTDINMTELAANIHITTLEALGLIKFDEEELVEWRSEFGYTCKFSYEIDPNKYYSHKWYKVEKKEEKYKIWYESENDKFWGTIKVLEYNDALEFWVGGRLRYKFCSYKLDSHDV